MSRAFFAHPKSWDDADVDRWRAALAADLAPMEVVAGRDDFIANIASEGHVGAWIRSVTSRRAVDTGERVYGLIVVPGEAIGKATANIIRDAVTAGVPVALAELNDAGTGIETALPVRAVDTVDPEDFLGGWRVIAG